MKNYSGLTWVCRKWQRLCLFLKASLLYNYWIRHGWSSAAMLELLVIAAGSNCGKSREMINHSVKVVKQATEKQQNENLESFTPRSSGPTRPVGRETGCRSQRVSGSTGDRLPAARFPQGETTKIPVTDFVVNARSCLLFHLPVSGVGRRRFLARQACREAGSRRSSSPRAFFKSRKYTRRGRPAKSLAHQSEDRVGCKSCGGHRALRNDDERE